MSRARSGSDESSRDALRLTPAENRYLDGACPPAELAEVEASLEANPARREALEAHREAMALWRSDVERDVDRIDPEAVAAEVLERIQRPAARPPRMAVHRVWAAAALVLIAFGAIGTMLVRPTITPTAEIDFKAIDESLIEAFTDAPETWLQEDGGR